MVASPVVARPASIVTLPRCTRLGCACQGRGAIVFFAAQVANPGTHPCYAALHLRSKRSASANRSTSLVKSLFYYGKRLPTAAADAAHSSNRLILLYDMAFVPPDAFQVVTTSRDLAIVCFHQPPAPTKFETAINTTMPMFITESEPGTIHSPAPLLLVQTGGWVLGGFLAKISLLRCKGPRNAFPGARA